MGCLFSNLLNIKPLRSLYIGRYPPVRRRQVVHVTKPNQTMKKQYIIKALTRIQELRAKQNELSKHGIDCQELLEPAYSTIEESIPAMLAKNDKQYEGILEDVQWWLYENVMKVIIVNGDNRDVKSAEDFTGWLMEFYGKEAK